MHLVDDLLNAAAVEMDPAKRADLYAQFQQQVAADVPVYWINSLPYHTAYDKRLTNLPTGFGAQCTQWIWLNGLNKNRCGADWPRISHCGE